MSEYRIVEHSYFIGKKRYEVQERLFGFLWWVNIHPGLSAFDGTYPTLEEAKVAMILHADKKKTSVVGTYKLSIIFLITCIIFSGCVTKECNCAHRENCKRFLVDPMDIEMKVIDNKNGTSSIIYVNKKTGEEVTVYPM